MNYLIFRNYLIFHLYQRQDITPKCICSFYYIYNNIVKVMNTTVYILVFSIWENVVIILAPLFSFLITKSHKIGKLLYIKRMVDINIFQFFLFTLNLYYFMMLKGNNSNKKKNQNYKYNFNKKKITISYSFYSQYNMYVCVGRCFST